MKPGCDHINCNQGRTCAELGMCQGREPACRDACHNPAIVPGGLPVERLQASRLAAAKVDANHLPPGGFWFAPGVIEAAPQPEPWGWLELSAAAIAAVVCVGVLTGAAMTLLRGVPHG